MQPHDAAQKLSEEVLVSLVKKAPIDIAAEPMGAEFEYDAFDARAARFHLVERLHSGEPCVRSSLHSIRIHTNTGQRSGAALSFLFLKLADEFPEISRFPKILVDRGIAHIRDIIEAGEPFHDQLADGF